jgi:phage N-6-adenine-methyltransferase
MTIYDYRTVILKKMQVSETTNSWITPDDLFRQLDQEFHFTLDVCADDSNAKCKTYFTEKQNGLKQSWANHICWMNPPYDNIESWMLKALIELKLNKTITVCLLPTRTDVKWFWEYVIDNAEIRFIKGRLKFTRGIYDGSVRKPYVAPYPSMIVVFRP